MKKIFLTSFLSLGLISSANAFDLYWENQYVSGGISYGFGGGNINQNIDYEFPDAESSVDIAKLNPETFGLHLAYGGSFYPNVRAELSFGYKNYMMDTDGKNGFINANFDWKDTNFYELLANIYYDFNTETAFTPYVGAGLGISYTDFKLGVTPIGGQAINAEFNKTGFVYNVLIGVSYSLTDYLAFDLAYRFMGTTEDISYEVSKTLLEEKDFELNSEPLNEIKLSMRYTF